MTTFALVLAADAAGGIGRDGGLPWRLKGDMAYFRRLTTGQGDNAVIMGRKTYASIPARFSPLRDRQNIVLTRHPEALSVPAAVDLATTFDDALKLADNADDIYVIGGGEVYRQALAHPGCRQVFRTVVDAVFDCDTFFELPASGWILGERSEPRVEAKLSYVFERWDRVERFPN